MLSPKSSLSDLPKDLLPTAVDDLTALRARVETALRKVLTSALESEDFAANEAMAHLWILIYEISDPHNVLTCIQ